MKNTDPHSDLFAEDQAMPPELAETERLIASLPVCRPSAALDERVAAALADEPPVSYPLPWVRRVWSAAAVLLIGLGVGIAALVILDDPAIQAPPAVVDASTGEAPAALARAEAPATIEQVWVASEPTGRIVVDHGQAMEAVRVTTVRHVSFEEDGVSYDLAVPVEQMVYIPASYK